MGFLHTLSKLVVEERKITPQLREKQDKKVEVVNSCLEFVDDFSRKKVIEIDALHSKGSHLIRKMTIHVKHYNLGNSSKSELKKAFIEAEHSLKEKLLGEKETSKVLSFEERKTISKIYHDKLDLIKKETGTF
ncbi:hypothetical protein [Metabacillus halosaccharovorans]|uniref:Uncharacterized protein n=1 Tax=Metabacillus halosaccharovorans TaxID=930124 RepID=A0ABT3DG43_9BACI|nr:hypothetical protein [Metabacillus halosaccharovorans]MCV9885642.1 hypothetical protein [Metabacillus halosaccharovorans]